MLKHAVTASLVVIALVATYIVIWLTGNYGTMGMLQNAATDIAEAIAAFVIGGAFLLLPFVSGSFAKGRFVSWIDKKVDPDVSFAWWHHILIGMALALIIGALYPFLTSLALQNSQILWVLQVTSPIRETSLGLIFNLLATAGWFWYGFGGFFLTYLVTKYK